MGQERVQARRSSFCKSGVAFLHRVVRHVGEIMSAFDPRWYVWAKKEFRRGAAASAKSVWPSFTESYAPLGE